ncbi:unnamed protein product [Sphagnum jensenii]|uniref:NADH-plastoquinone oxidoreductase subunit K n=1 Tax=Sphagnum jensenii TaxID=128206 RepID=A0ABP0WYE4_9BRYO
MNRDQSSGRPFRHRKGNHESGIERPIDDSGSIGFGARWGLEACLVFVAISVVTDLRSIFDQRAWQKTG